MLSPITSTSTTISSPPNPPTPPPTTPRTIYLGTFISAPDPGPTSSLCMRRGAVLVSAGPPGVIEKVDWTVRDGKEARVRFGLAGGGGEGEGEVEVVELDVDGEGRGGRFWFPGFVGK